MRFSDIEEFLTENPNWQEKRKLICTCEQQRYKEHTCPLDKDTCNCCTACTNKCANIAFDEKEG